MEVALIILSFLSNALAMDCLYNDRKKLTGVLIIVNLCLTVAIAYQFNQIKNIFYVLLVVLAIGILFFILRIYLKKKRQEAMIIENKEIEKNEEI